MRIPRIYVPQVLQIGQLTLSKETTQHIINVLRLRVHSPLVIFNGEGDVFTARLVDPNKKSAVVGLTQRIEENNESPLHTHLALAAIKGDRMTYALQKAVELGVSIITPVLTEHTVIRLDEERADTRQLHWQGILQSASEQCHRTMLPRINPVMPLDQWLNNVPVAELQCYFDPLATSSLSNIKTVPRSVNLIIGPEGGLSDRDCQNAQQKQFQGLRMGPRILRAETAVVTALSAVQMLWGDFR